MQFASARPTLSLRTLALLASVTSTLLFDSTFFRALAAGRDPHALSTWWFVAAVAIALTAILTAILLIALQRPIAKALLALLFLGSAVTGYYVGAYGIYLDPGMMRNVLHTDVREAFELVSLSMLASVALLAGVPIALLAWIRIAPSSRRDALVVRPLLALLSLAIAVAALLTVGRSFASLMRNSPDVRYLATPLNYLWSLPVAAFADEKTVIKPRAPVGLDAHRASRANARPAFVVLVIGEAARAANWQLDGYARETTPELAARNDVINFPNATSCGTSTEASLPCLFAPFGRAHAERARASESLLDVAQRAGIDVLWRDNQSGCKSVCAGVRSELIDAKSAPQACRDGQCYDEGLLEGFDAVVAHAAQRDALLVLHQKGSHGPGYFRRYPPAFRRFAPACEARDLTDCTPGSIVNAYDNTIAYTDHVLAQTIALLAREDATRDAALLYVSDHGESLGEDGLYLHGLPWAIARLASAPHLA